MISHTEENYLKAIFKLGEDGTVSTSALAHELNINAASVSDKMKKLAEKNLISYQKSKGAKLSAKGKKIALATIRKHRIWESFLVQHLGFKWDEVHDIAEQLEHVQSEVLIEKLDAVLGYPKHDPHGDPIPDVSGKITTYKSILLSEKKTGSKCVLCGVVDHSNSFLKYLDKIGLSIGDTLVVKEIEEFDKTITVTLKNKKDLSLSYLVASNLWVTI